MGIRSERVEAVGAAGRTTWMPVVGLADETSVRGGSEVYLSFARLGASRPPQRVQVETTRRRVGWVHRSAEWQNRRESEPWRLVTGRKHRTNGWSKLSRRKITQALTDAERKNQ